MLLSEHLFNKALLFIRLSPIKTELEINNLQDVSWGDLRLIISYLKVNS